MLVLILGLLGLSFGSFVNAFVWRLHMQSKKSSVVSRQPVLRSCGATATEDGSSVKKTEDRRQKTEDKEFSIFRGRSMCPNCRHILGVADLVPIFSWLSLKGKCRYCSKPISWQYPLVELITAILFVVSYIYWPNPFGGLQNIYFGLWLVFVTFFIALIIYDLRWLTLPNSIIYPLMGLASLEAIIKTSAESNHIGALVATLWGVAIGGGLFYALFQVSDGRWIGGGDVKLGAMLGILLGGPINSLLMLFLAAVLGSAWSVPLLAARKLKRTSKVPFGPFLIMSAIIIQLAGAGLITWYKRLFLFS